MPKFKVDITRTWPQVATILLEADDAEAAEAFIAEHFYVLITTAKWADSTKYQDVEYDADGWEVEEDDD
jgi:hypothetical protein